MNDEDIKRLSEDELARHIDGLESQPWLQDIRGLQPHADSQDFYALGYAAGQHATLQRSSSRWNTVTTAVLSSVVSTAATALLMWQLSPSQAPSSADRELAGQPINNVESDVKPQLTEPTKAATAPQDRMEAAAEANLEDILPRRRQLASALLIVPSFGGDSENESGQIDSERTRYVTQRQRWLSELSASMPD